MQFLKIKEGSKLKGEITVSGAKNVAMKVVLAGLLTDKSVEIGNIPQITSVEGTAELVRCLGVKVTSKPDHTLKIEGGSLNSHTVPLAMGGLFRTATMVMGPLLARFGKAVVPNPGGCRLGKRPVDWHIKGLSKMGASIKYDEGFFYATAHRLKGTRFKFDKNTHTGTETMMLAAVLADGETVIENAAMEPEIDDLMKLLNSMGARIKRTESKTIVVYGVKKMTGAKFDIMPDRNEAVTFAVGAVATGGDLVIRGARKKELSTFLGKLAEIGAGFEIKDDETIRFYRPRKKIKASRVTTSPHPGFMTDWQAPWAILMTQADGISTIHETVFEDRFSYVSELLKMGADIEGFSPKVRNPKKFYNFNWSDRKVNTYQAIRIRGGSYLHEAFLEMTDLRAGATLILAALLATGESIIYGIDHVDRGYENIDLRLKKIGADIERMEDNT
ncbi:MAG: UDP-N-acetylglucosamine1-carboxyvinyltransferase, UDP-N-acetylglucosamine 1-carboxyvinyltransferase [Candidatus Gottesmanbacteria bacterium GW2011_GWA2_43_14]|uniref:UDP-N-acetylglucosamine 1-carboxyvinyltransferase n=1 Tax=Candidatus Gottesmanbacteria bacterium GW2011_GWA2_43_14 TaxID=1618443 RepID=A0A0G1DLW7_9BACT|nr:MAG: UDP-N-acetylglucosamine1-carboxyvinyltransferase, UDP-N-acetylglucosamine 1-carboxyvinyltransferase [Candidatus Gottesmanbacteria bacterium GW2011_GWA2_43_14]